MSCLQNNVTDLIDRLRAQVTNDYAFVASSLEGLRDMVQSVLDIQAATLCT